MASEHRPVWGRTAAGIGVGLALGAVVASQVPAAWFDVGRPPDPVGAEGPPLEPVLDGPDARRHAIAVKLVPMIVDVGQPTDLAFVPGHPDRLVVTSKWGSIHLVDVPRGLREFWIWLEVHDGLECGVLGIAFHPDFERTGRFFVNHVPATDDPDALRTVVTEYRVDPRTLREPKRVADLLSTDQPAGTHNGGQLRFGPDGMLYVALGDGGAGGDPFRSGQDLTRRLGTILRIDVSEPGSGRPPSDNPFVRTEGADPLIWAWGLRNPWRFTFAPGGRLIVADVGQSRFEEIDVVQAGDNLGWSLVEGPDCFQPPEDCRHEELVDPVYVYGRLEGASITGGEVWEAPGPLQGRYLFGDFVTGRLWAMPVPRARERVESVIALGRFDISPTAFTRDPDGALWLADFRAETVFRIEPVATR